MSSSKKLWLGFGTLIVLLVVSVLTMTVRLLSIEGQVSELANAARARSVAVRELESAVLSYALDVRTHLRTDDPVARLAAAEHVEGVARLLAAYRQLVSTANQRELAARFADLWREFTAVGEDLLSAGNRQRSAGKGARLHTLRVELQSFLDDAMQIDAIAAYDRSKDAAFKSMDAIIGFALTLLAVGVVIAVATSVAVARGILNTETSLREHRERLRVTLASIGDAIISTDGEGRVTTLNAVAEALTGWSQEEAARRPLEEVYRIINEETRQSVEDPVKNVLSQGDVVGLRTTPC
ncbi:MAG: PAS domain-containing protein [Gammaproteobacteria bacterium]